MKRVENKIASTSRKATKSQVHKVPLVVPHAGAEADRDFESAFDVLDRSDGVHELWRGSPE